MLSISFPPVEKANVPRELKIKEKKIKIGHDAKRGIIISYLEIKLFV